MKRVRDLIVLVVSMLFILMTGTAAEASGSKISSGSSHNLVVKADGSLWGAGLNYFGQLGDGTFSNRSSFTQAGSDQAWSIVAAGQDHSVGIKTDGSLWTWGVNWTNQPNDWHNTPWQVGPGEQWIAVSAGNTHTVVIRADGTLWAWGQNDYGQLGDGTYTPRLTPVQIGSDDQWTAVAAGSGHTLALKGNGSLWAWGANDYGQLGDGTNAGKTSPVRVGAQLRWTAVAAGAVHTAALASDGTLWMWGYNAYGQLGDGTMTDRNVPVKIGTATWSSVACGQLHTLAIGSDNTLWTWGADFSGQLGDGGTASRTTPYQVGTDNHWLLVAGGGNHSLAMKSDGGIFAWGDNYYGQNGNGNGWTDQPASIMPAGPFPDLAVSPQPLTGGSMVPFAVAAVPLGSTTSFTVTPSAGYTILSVTGCGGTLAGGVYTTGRVMHDCAVVARFATGIWPLDIAVTGSGTVHTAPEPDQACTGICSQLYAEGQNITLTASAIASDFLGWGGACSGTGSCTVSMTNAQSVTASFGDYGSVCSEPVTFGSGQIRGSSINDLGEIVWSQLDGTGLYQVYSSIRGRLTSNPYDHFFPSLNNRGDVVFELMDPSGQMIVGLISGQTVTFGQGSSASINDSREVIWVRQNPSSNRNDVYSTVRGYLNIAGSVYETGITNAGDVVWTQGDDETGFAQVFKLAAGTATPVRITSDGSSHFQPSISNAGEIVWVQGGASSAIYSSMQGLVAPCPAGNHLEPSVNACGDVVFTNMDPTSGDTRMYRQGNGAPCVSDPEPNDTMYTAAEISGTGTTRGILAAGNDLEDWYRFTANGGDRIEVSLSWNTGPNAPVSFMLLTLTNDMGLDVTAQETGMPKTISLTAPQTGNYYIHIATGPNVPFGYSLSVQVGPGGGACSDAVSSGEYVMGSSVNDLGEVVWSENDGTGHWQVYSSTRGKLTNDQNEHLSPSLNNRGDVVYEYTGPAGQSIAGLISGRTVTFGEGRRPSINDNREVVWVRQNPATYRDDAYSTTRGYLNLPAMVYEVWINNAGDVVWTQDDPSSGFPQVFKLPAGTTIPVRVTSDSGTHTSPRISNSGEIVWTLPLDMNNASIYSSTRGIVGPCPAGVHMDPSVNACGDVTFTNYDQAAGLIYRSGAKAPCVTDVEPNNYDPMLITRNTPTTGMLNPWTDPSDTYQFTANAGDRIQVTVNWAPTDEPNMLNVSLARGTDFWQASEPGSPKTITTIAPATGTYVLHLDAYMGETITYTVLVEVNSSTGCSDQVSSGPYANGSSINDLGEIVWSEMDPVSGQPQIYSNRRGQLTSGPNANFFPSLNNRGDVVFEQPGMYETSVVGLISGQTVNFGEGRRPAINDEREIVLIRWNQEAGRNDLYSTVRGYLNIAGFVYDAGINNAGDVVWAQDDVETGFPQVFKLAAGTATPVRITNDAHNHNSPRISNAGELVWSQQDDPMSSSIYSSTRGVVGLCPAGSHAEPSVNACGDITFRSTDPTGAGLIYRAGNNAPCTPDAEPNNSLSSPADLAVNSTSLGILSFPSDSEDWFKFEVNEHDTITLSANWDTTTPNMLFIELLNSAIQVVSSGVGPGNPIVLNSNASNDGTYYAHVIATGGRIGYALSLDIVPAPRYLLSVAREAGSTGSGLVTSDPAGVNANLVSGGTGTTGSFIEGKIVTLTATPAAGSTFTGWGGACSGPVPICTVTMDAANDVTTAFTLLPASTAATLTADKPGLGLLSNIGTVTFTATAGGGTGIYEYKFRIKDNALGTWSIVRDYSSTNTWSWPPTQAGSYDIQVMVRNVGSQAAYEQMRKLTFNIVASSPVSSVTLTANKPSPAIYGTVGTITFTSQAGGGTGASEYQFRSRTNPGGTWAVVQAYSPANTWSWSPAAPGSYDIQVMARNAGSGASYEALSPILTFNVITATPVSSVTLTADKTTPAIFGTIGTVTFTGAATGGTGSAEYRFRIKDDATAIWTIVQDYSAVSTWSWTPTAAGTYTIEVRARNAGSAASYEALRTMSFNVVTSTPVSSVTLTASKTSPALLGTVGTVTLTANAAGGSSSYEYKFVLKDDSGIWTTVQDYPGTNTWTWTPGMAGAYVIKVMARNAGSASTYEAFATVNFNIVTSTPVSAVTLTADKPSGSPAGSTITFTGNAMGGTGSYEYKFQVKDSSGIWATMREYSTGNTWAWTPGQAGTFVIKVMTKNAGSPASYEQFRTMTLNIVN